jgi:hypothetical protein
MLSPNSLKRLQLLTSQFRTTEAVGIKEIREMTTGTTIETITGTIIGMITGMITGRTRKGTGMIGGNQMTFPTILTKR